MRLTLELELECAGEREARALEATLSPDNKSIPKDQKFEARRAGRTVRVVVESSRPAGAISSAVSVLTDAKLFQDVWAVTS